jgi:integrase
LEILNKYKNHPICIEKGKCLAVPSHVKYNAYFKEIGDIADIPKNKPLVTHLARKTFATTIALTNGMNIGVLSKILGHNSIKVTLDSYGTIIDELMLRSVKELKAKRSQNIQQQANSEHEDETDAKTDLIKKSREISLN